MMGLWADGWFYISSAGLLISGILFFFLLGQYRVASEAADASEGEQGADKEISAPSVVRPVYIPEEAAAAPRVASHAEPKPEAKPDLPKPKPDAEAPRRDPANSTGGISPAVVYLQNIKIELADLHKDLRTLAKRVDDELASVSTRDEALIERLGELTRAVEGFKAAQAEAAPAPAPAPEPAPRKARKEKAAPAPEPAPEPALVLEKAPEPAPAEPAPAPVKAEPADVVVEVLPPPAPDAIPEFKREPSPDETIRMDLSALVSPEPKKAPAVEPAPEPAPAAEPAPEPEKPRRGPVWPV